MGVTPNAQTVEGPAFSAIAYQPRGGLSGLTDDREITSSRNMSPARRSGRSWPSASASCARATCWSAPSLTAWRALLANC